MTGPVVPVFETTEIDGRVRAAARCPGCRHPVVAWLEPDTWSAWLHNPRTTPLDPRTRYVLRTGRHPGCGNSEWRAA